MTKERLEQLAKAREIVNYNNCTCSTCGKLFKKRASLMNHVRWIHKEGKTEDRIGIVKVNTDKDKKERTCSFCRKTWNCFIWHFHKHEAECKQNPNRRIWKGHPQSEETKKKLSEIGLKNPYRRLMRKTQLYKGILYDSSWEVEFAKKLESLNETFERPKEPIKYIGEDGREHNYFPDFYLVNRKVFVEIKNPYSSK